MVGHVAGADQLQLIVRHLSKEPALAFRLHQFKRNALLEELKTLENVQAQVRGQNRQALKAQAEPKEGVKDSLIVVAHYFFQYKLCLREVVSVAAGEHDAVQFFHLFEGKRVWLVKQNRHDLRSLRLEEADVRAGDEALVLIPILAFNLSSKRLRQNTDGWSLRQV